MCLAIPGRVVRLSETGSPLPLAEVDFAGVRKTVNLAYVPEAAVGDFVIVHAGFATARIGEREALEALEYARQLSSLAEASPAAVTTRSATEGRVATDPAAST
jgi:hydrogenase expression/formation protein HypC